MSVVCQDRFSSRLRVRPRTDAILDLRGHFLLSTFSRLPSMAGRPSPPHPRPLSPVPGARGELTVVSCLSGSFLFAASLETLHWCATGLVRSFSTFNFLASTLYGREAIAPSPPTPLPRFTGARGGLMVFSWDSGVFFAASRETLYKALPALRGERRAAAYRS